MSEIFDGILMYLKDKKYALEQRLKKEESRKTILDRHYSALENAINSLIDITVCEKMEKEMADDTIESAFNSIEDLLNKYDIDDSDLATLACAKTILARFSVTPPKIRDDFGDGIE